MRHHHLLPILLVALALAALPAAPGYGAPGDDAFTWSVSIAPERVEPGAAATATATLTIADSHIVYADMTGVTPRLPEGFTAGTVNAPKGELKDDPFGFEPREIFTGAVAYTIPIRVGEDVKPGRYTLAFDVKHQGCSETICFFPTSATRSVALQVGSGEAAAAGGAVSAGAPSQARGFAATVQRGWWAAFLTVFVGGVLTSFTPCVYPLIPITVSVFGATAAAGRGRAFLLSLIYVLGIAAMYSVLGLAAAATGRVFGQMLANPVVVGFVAAVFVVFGLSMFGLFEVQLPSKWQTALTGVGKAGPAGAFGMGLVAGIVAAPCTGPVLGAVLTYVATTGNLALGFLLLFTFAVGMGLLFVALGTFAGLAARLPRSGPWMDGVKAVFGIVMFAMALYFLKEVLPVLKRPLGRGTQTWVWVMLLLVAGYVLGALRGSFRGLRATAFLRKSVAVGACVTAVYIAFGSLMLPPQAEAAELAWRTDLDAALAEAKAAGRPVMIDFFAEWCVECKLLEADTFTTPSVAERLGEFTLVRIDLTEDTARTRALRERYGIPGLPFVVFVDPRGDVRDDLTLTGFENAAQFLTRLQQVDPA